MSQVSSLIDIYDTEIGKIDKGPVAWIADRQGQPMDLENFRRTVVGKFEDIGFVVNVKAFETNQSGVFGFDIEITGRTENHAFDFDQMKHEVRNAVLDDPKLPGGVIDTNRAMADMREERVSHKGHRH